MSYYAYGRQMGDPGFLSLLGKIGKTALNVGSGFIPGGGIVKSAIGAVSKVAQRAQPIIKAARAHPVLTGAAAAGTVAVGGGMIMGGPSAAGPVMTVGPGGGVLPPMPGGMGMVRMSRTGRHIRINPRTGKAIRRMRVTNTKALNRAVRRCMGFAHMAKKILHFTSPHTKHTGRPVFRKRRRKS